MHVAVRTPEVFLPPVWPLPRSLATTSGISVDFFSSPYLDVSVQAVSFIRLFDSPYDDISSYAGFPHSEIHGSKAAFASPWLFADCCVLRRLLVPRHSPCALCSLTIFESLWFSVISSLDDNLNCSFTLNLNYLLVCFTLPLFSFQGAFFEVLSLLGKMVGSSGLEPPTSRLSGVRSNHLSYEPIYLPFGKWWR